MAKTVMVETVTGSDGQTRTLRVIANVCSETPWCNDTSPMYYDSFERRDPQGFDADLVSDQFRHPFSAAFVCNAHSLTDLSCLSERVREFYIDSIANAVLDWGGIIETPEYRIHDEQMLETRTWPMQPEWGIDRRNRTVKREQRVAYTISRWSFSYYHFVTEALWRIVRVLPELRRDWNARRGGTYDGLKIISFESAFARQYIVDVLGVHEEQIVWGPAAKSWRDTDAGCIIEAGQLVYPSASYMVAPSRNRLRTLRQTVTEAVMSSDNDTNDDDLVLYFSRKGEWARSVKDERSVLDVLQAAFPRLRLIVVGRKAGLLDTGSGSISYARATDIPQVVRLVQRARVIVGPHGAGLSNILWARPGTAVVELLPSTSSTLIYWHVSEALGLHYSTVLLPEAHWRSTALRVPLKVLEHTLHNVVTVTLPMSTTSTTTTTSLTTVTPTTPTDLGLTCPPGTFVDRQRQSCRLCPVGTYQSAPLTKATRCDACPTGTSTDFEEWSMSFVPRRPVLRNRYGCDSATDCHHHASRKRDDDGGGEKTYYPYGYYDNHHDDDAVQEDENRPPGSNDPPLADPPALDVVLQQEQKAGGPTPVLLATIISVSLAVVICAFISATFLARQCRTRNDNRGAPEERCGQELPDEEPVVDEGQAEEDAPVATEQRPLFPALLRPLPQRRPDPIMGNSPRTRYGAEPIDLLDDIRNTLLSRQKLRREHRRTLLEERMNRQVPTIYADVDEWVYVPPEVPGT